MPTEGVRITATALIVRDGMVLLGKRTSTTRFALQWDPMGGHLEPGEAPEDALRREVREEAGIEVLRFKFLGTYEDVDSTSGDRFRHHVFVVTGWRGEPRPSPEHSELRWFAPREIPGLNMTPSLRAILPGAIAANP